MKQVDQIWTYCESDHGVTPISPIEILRLSPKRSQSLRVRFLEGDLAGLEQWVHRSRLRVPWEEGAAWQHDERRLTKLAEAAVPAEEDWSDVQALAVREVFWAYPRSGAINVWWVSGRPPGLLNVDFDDVTEDLGLNPSRLLAEPFAFRDRTGTYYASWFVAKDVARLVTTVFADEILASLQKREAELHHQAVHGKWDEGSRSQPGRLVDPDVFAKRLKEEQPILDLIRSWCGAAAKQRFDERTALKAEVERLRILVRRAAWSLEVDHPLIAKRLLKDLDAPSRRRRRAE